MNKVTVYSTPTCVYCKMAKEYFTQHSVAFDEKDVYHDEKAREEMFEKSGQMGVPVIRVEKEGEEPQYIVGFQKELLAGLLNIAE